MTKVWKIAAAAAIAWSAMQATQAQEVYVHGGTLGAGIGAAMPLTSWLGAHAEIEGMGFSHTVNVDGGDYDGHLGLLNGGLYLDLFPIGNTGFRITAGALINNDELTATAVPTADGFYKIGSTLVPVMGEAPSAKATLPHVMPYIGIGYGHKPVTKGFGLTVDVGAAYGQPKVSYFVPAVYNNAVSAADIAQEEANINDKVSRYKWYPVVQVGVSYRF